MREQPYETALYRGYRIESRYMGDGDFTVDVFLPNIGPELRSRYRYWTIPEAKRAIDSGIEMETESERDRRYAAIVRQVTLEGD